MELLCLGINGHCAFILIILLYILLLTFGLTRNTIV